MTAAKAGTTVAEATEGDAEAVVDAVEEAVSTALAQWAPQPKRQKVTRSRFAAHVMVTTRKKFPSSWIRQECHAARPCGRKKLK